MKEIDTTVTPILQGDVSQIMFENMRFDFMAGVIIFLIILNLAILGYFIYEKLKEKKIIIKQPDKEIFTTFETNSKVDEFVDKRLTKVFDRLIQRKYLFFYKSFNNLSDDNILKAKEDFINLVEIEFTAQEKILLQKRFDNFNSFKYYLIDFFNDRMTKFQFVMSFNYESGDIFKDINIYKSVMNSESNDILKIMEQFNK